MKYRLRFVPAVNPSAKGFCTIVDCADDEFICGEKERCAMELEKQYGIPWICVEVERNS